MVTGFHLPKTTGQARSAAPTRTGMPRERISDTCLVNLSQHVEPRRVSSGQTFALAVIGSLVCFILGLALSSCKEASPETLDAAQEAFEHRATPADFETWRGTGALKCHDFETLRICEAQWVLYSPEDGKPFGRDRVTFACSTSVCSWVDP